MTEDRRFKALFFDVDGTLVSFRTHRVPDSAREALCEAHERGVKLYIATGRAAKDLEVLEGIPCDGVVALNGSHCVAGDGRTVGSVPIPARISSMRSPLPGSWASRWPSSSTRGSLSTAFRPQPRSGPGWWPIPFRWSAT